MVEEFFVFRVMCAVYLFVLCLVPEQGVEYRWRGWDDALLRAYDRLYVHLLFVDWRDRVLFGVLV